MNEDKLYLFIIIGMIKTTRNNLEKIKTLYNDLGYEVLFEKGQFQSGYCIIEARNLVVINKYFGLEGRIQSLVEILNEIHIEESLLSVQSLTFLKGVQASLEKTL